ncbi:MAG TPA: hypothetical protein VGO43_13640 [Pyrinomonadaceae bacterium]|nr:hypothetical protein [Pyrinomonadaceae bacterium]
MANPAAITVTDCLMNSVVTQPATQAFDTDGDIPIAVGGRMDRLILEIINTAGAALTVTIKAGDNPPSPLAADLAVALAATGGGTAKRIIGPFESARFLQDDGTVLVNFLAASSTPAGTIRAYRLPKM